MLRPASPHDVGAIAALFAVSRAEAMPWLPVVHTPAEDLHFFRRVLAEQRVVVALVEGRVAGFVATGGGCLHHLYVDPRCQRQGLGDQLLRHAKAAMPKGFRFWVFQQNEHARGFYERRGARLLELRDGADNEERAPDALYQWLPS